MAFGIFQFGDHHLGGDVAPVDDDEIGHVPVTFPWGSRIAEPAPGRWLRRDAGNFKSDRFELRLSAHHAGNETGSGEPVSETAAGIRGRLPDSLSPIPANQLVAGL